jgi:creatinine amidohydrolase
MRQMLSIAITCCVLPGLAAAQQITARDTVFVEQMTVTELRAAIAAGKTTVLVMAGGMEDNGPYVEIAQHNSIVRELGNRIARRLGNTLVAPVAGIAPGTGIITLSEATYKSLLIDMAASLRTQGFRNILLLADHDADVAPAEEVAASLRSKWKGSGTNVWYVPEYYNYTAAAAYSANALGNREKPEGYHDDYFVDAISAASDPEVIRLPERARAGRTSINGIDLAAPKAVEDGKKIIEFRVEAAVKAIRNLLGDDKK